LRIDGLFVFLILISNPAVMNFENLLSLRYNGTDEEPWLTSQRALRRLIGVLGIALPFLLVGIIYMDVRYFGTMESISHYYYTRANSVFIIVVSLMAIFLLIYKGRRPVDFYISSLAGICALLLVMFPTGNIVDQCPNPEKAYAITVLAASEGRENFHYATAAIFMTCLAAMSFFFTRVEGPRGKTKRKKYRNTIYAFCGLMMVAALAVVAMRALEIVIDKEFYDKHHLTFWMESIAIEFFGISWLVKGETVLRDEPLRVPQMA
jgi:hypothetical protein